MRARESINGDIAARKKRALAIANPQRFGQNGAEWPALKAPRISFKQRLLK